MTATSGDVVEVRSALLIVKTRKRCDERVIEQPVVVHDKEIVERVAAIVGQIVGSDQRRPPANDAVDQRFLEHPVLDVVGRGGPEIGTHA